MFICLFHLHTSFAYVLIHLYIYQMYSFVHLCLYIPKFRTFTVLGFGYWFCVVQFNTSADPNFETILPGDVRNPGLHQLLTIFEAIDSETPGMSWQICFIASFGSCKKKTKNPVFRLFFLFRTRQKDEELSPGLLFFGALCGSESLVFQRQCYHWWWHFHFYVRLQQLVAAESSFMSLNGFSWSGVLDAFSHPALHLNSSWYLVVPNLLCRSSCYVSLQRFLSFPLLFRSPFTISSIFDIRVFERKLMLNTAIHDCGWTLLIISLSGGGGVRSRDQLFFSVQ